MVKVRNLLRKSARATISLKGNRPLLEKVEFDEARFFNNTIEAERKALYFT